jgi:hypothetical protein
MVFISPNIVLSQSETSVQDIFEKISEKRKVLEEENKQEIVNVTVDLLIKDAQKSFVRYLDPSFEYTIIAVGDRRIDKLTLTVYRPGIPDWQYITENSGKMPMVSISLVDSEPFEFAVNVNKYSAKNEAGHFAVIIYHRIP